jgi:hypothetical protein
MAFPRESVEQRRDVIPRRVRVVARVLWCQSIKLPVHVSRSGDDVRQVPSSEVDPARGGV